MDIALIRARLRSVMQQDIHQQGDAYLIRSLYFDDFDDNCLDENEAGVDLRHKYRIRLYDPAAQDMRLEIKSKVSGLTHKTSSRITRQECAQMMQGRAPAAFDSRKALSDMRVQMLTRLMRPRAIIEYERCAFVYPAGNVRITFDRNITASRACGDFLKDTVSCRMPLLPQGMHVLEVKYDELLPDYIAQLLEIRKLQQSAFSKYYLGRLAICGEFAASVL